MVKYLKKLGKKQNAYYHYLYSTSSRSQKISQAQKEIKGIRFGKENIKRLCSQKTQLDMQKVKDNLQKN